MPILFDELWKFIFSFLSYIDLVLLARTCKRLNILINSLGFMKRAGRHLADVFVIPMDHAFLMLFAKDFTRHFNKHWSGYANNLYLKYFLSICQEQLNERILFGHLYWCVRNSTNKYYYKFCCPVTRCMIFDTSEDDMCYKYELVSYKRWDEKFLKIF